MIKVIAASIQSTETLDVPDIKKDLAKRLADDDVGVGAILACINATNKLNTLKLA